MVYTSVSGRLQASGDGQVASSTSSVLWALLLLKKNVMEQRRYGGVTTLTGADEKDWYCLMQREG